MRRLNRLVLMSRAVQGAEATAAATVHRRLLQAAPLHSTTTINIPAELNLVFAAGGVSCTKFFSAATSSIAEDVSPAIEPPVKVLPSDVVLYQYEACPFCNKVKGDCVCIEKSHEGEIPQRNSWDHLLQGLKIQLARIGEIIAKLHKHVNSFLDYYDIPYKIVEVNPMSKKEIKWSDYKKVPILMVDGEQMVDSSEIIDKLFKKIHPEVCSDPASANEEERKWLGWVDNHLVHVLSPNIYRTASEALESFDYITTHGNFSLTERIFAKYAGATAMYFVSKKLKKRHNITDERKALYEAAETWVDALKGQNYLGGQKPNLADLSVFGILRPIRHLKSGKDMVENTHIGDWYKRMESAVGDSSKIQA